MKLVLYGVAITAVSLTFLKTMSKAGTLILFYKKQLDLKNSHELALMQLLESVFEHIPVEELKKYKETVMFLEVIEFNNIQSS